MKLVRFVIFFDMPVALGAGMRRWMAGVFSWAVICLMAVMAAGLSSCGSDNTFTINGKVEGFGTGNLRVVYFDKGAVQSMSVSAVDGAFSMTGRSEKPVMARIYTGSGRWLATFIARKGDKLEAVIDVANPMKTEITGSKENERLTEFLKAHAGAELNGDPKASKALNADIEAYIAKNPDHLASGVLLSDFYSYDGSERQALEALNSLGNEVKTVCTLATLADALSPMAEEADSLRLEPFAIYTSSGKNREITPDKAARTVIMFTDADARVSKPLTDMLAKVMPHVSGDGWQVADISVDTDTMTWKKSLREIADSADFKAARYPAIIRAWAPGPYNISAFERMPVGRTPWVVVTDSTRRVLYRGESPSEAARALGL